MLSQKRFNLAFQELFRPKKTAKPKKSGDLESKAEDSLPVALVACSGGVDSMVLLDLMRVLYRSRGQEAKLTVCYVDHRQRLDVTKDLAVVSDYCTRHQLQLAIRSLSYAPEKAPEEWLREARYEALKQVAVDRVVFTGHHAQDQIETLLFRLIRGAHPATIVGIPAKSRHRSGLRLARPLLGFSKSDVLDYAGRKGLEWHEDSTNQSLDYARNRIRNQLLPLLEDLRPGTSHRLLAFFDALAAERPRKPKQRKEQIGQIRKQLLSNEGLPVLTSDFATLKAVVDDFLDGKSQRTTRAHWDSLKRQLQSRRMTRWGGGPRKIVQFPGGHALCFEGNRVFWIKG